MSIEIENHIPQATYQAVLIQGLISVITRINNGEIRGAWRANKTLYRVLPAECKKECEQTLHAIIEHINQIVANTKGIDVTYSRAVALFKVDEYLEVMNDMFLELCQTSLERHHWLTKDSRLQALNPTPKHIGGGE